MKTKFVVKAIADAYSGVELTLIKYRKPEPLPPEPEPEPVINPLDTFVAENDEERIVLKMFKAIEKFVPSMFTPISRPPARAFRITGPVIKMKLPLSKEEYDDMGKPGLRQMLELEIAKVKEE